LKHKEKDSPPLSFDIWKAQLLAHCASLSVLYPCTKVITVITTNNETSTGTASEILGDAISSHGLLWGLFGGMGYLVLSHVQYTMIYRGLSMSWWKRSREAEQHTPASNTKTEPSRRHLFQRIAPHLRSFAILFISTYFSYPFETLSRRQQISSGDTTWTHQPDLWAGIGYKILATSGYQCLLGIIHSETCSTFFRRIILKLLH